MIFNGGCRIFKYRVKRGDYWSRLILKSCGGRFKYLEGDIKADRSVTEDKGERAASLEKR